VRRSLKVVFLVLLWTLSITRLPAQTVQLLPQLSAEQMEKFLLTARITRIQNLGQGVTNSRRATLSDGQITHDVHVQVIDESRPLFDGGRVVEVGFKDSYRYNIAGYRLALLLDMDNVPMSVERVVDGKTAAVTWWIDDVLMDEGARVKQQVSDPDPQRQQRNLHLMRVFDELIYNTDRNQGNLIWAKDWKMWLIDHTRAFRLARELRNSSDLSRVDRELLQAMGRSLNREEIQSVLARRDLLVKFFDTRIAERGEAAVLYSRR
jgi:hypothetical protein